MDKETLSNYGWVVIVIIILCILLGMATPFGNFIKASTMNAVDAVTQELCDKLGIDPPITMIEDTKYFTITPEGVLGIRPEYIPLDFEAGINRAAVLSGLSVEDVKKYCLYKEITTNGTPNLSDENIPIPEISDEQLMNAMVTYCANDGIHSAILEVENTNITIEQYLLNNMYNSITGEATPAGVTRADVDAAARAALLTNESFVESRNELLSDLFHDKNGNPDIELLVCSNILMTYAYTADDFEYNEEDLPVDKNKFKALTGISVDDVIISMFNNRDYDFIYNYMDSIVNTDKLGVNEYIIYNNEIISATYDETLALYTSDFAKIENMYARTRYNINNSSNISSLEILNSCGTWSDIDNSITGLPKGTVVPSIIDGYTVTTIPESLFLGQPIVRLELPDTVTTIGQAAFAAMPNLKELRWSSGTTEMSAFLFAYDTLLKTVTNTDDVTSMSFTLLCSAHTITGDMGNPNDRCGLQSISLPNIQAIPSYAFAEADIIDFTIPASCTDIGSGAFACCKNLHSLRFENPDTVIHDDITPANFQVPQDLIIYGYAGSTAEVFANTKGYTFVVIQ